MYLDHSTFIYLRIRILIVRAFVHVCVSDGVYIMRCTKYEIMASHYRRSCYSSLTIDCVSNDWGKVERTKLLTLLMQQYNSKHRPFHR